MNAKEFARAWIIGGFLLLAVGSFLVVVVLATHGYFNQGSLRANLQLFSQPAGSLATLWAWWMLSKVAVIESEHLVMFKRAFFGLMVASLCFGLSYVNILWNSPFHGFYAGAWWCDALGSLGAAAGFFLMARAFSPVVKVDEASEHLDT